MPFCRHLDGVNGEITLNNGRREVQCKGVRSGGGGGWKGHCLIWTFRPSDDGFNGDKRIQEGTGKANLRALFRTEPFNLQKVRPWCSIHQDRTSRTPNREHRNESKSEATMMTIRRTMSEPPFRHYWKLELGKTLPSPRTDYQKVPPQ